MNTGITSYWELAVNRAGDRPADCALVFVREDAKCEEYSWTDLITKAETYGGWLAARGIRSGSRVLIVGVHRPEVVFALLGALRQDAIACVYPALMPSQDRSAHAAELHRVVREWRVDLAVCPDETAQLLRECNGGLDPAVSFEELHREPVVRVASATGAKCGGVLFATSGTTGVPKGSFHPHDALLDQMRTFYEWLRLEGDEAAINWLPLYHDLGLATGVLIPLYAGVRSVLLSPLAWMRNPAILFDAIERYRGAYTALPNFALRHAVRALRPSQVREWDLGSMRVLLCAGEPNRAEDIDLFLSRFGPHGLRREAVAPVYGMAESLTTSLPDMGEGPTVDRVSRQALQLGGRAEPAPTDETDAVTIVEAGRPRVELRILSEEGTPRAERQTGEIAIRGAGVIDRYFGRDDLSRTNFRDGWLLTGDIGYTVGNRLFVCGRKKDVIIASGRNVHPELIESAAGRVEGVELARAAAFGVEDESGGSEGIVFAFETRRKVAPEASAELARRVRESVLRQTGLRLHDVFVATRGLIVRTTSGKIARAATRERYLSLRDAVNGSC